MRDFHAIVEGIVQGLTEFLPISSTAHLRIVPAFFGWEDPGAAFTAVVQLGTMAAVLLYFRHDLWRIASTWVRSLRDPALRGELDARMGWYIIVGTIPIGIFGFIFRDQIENGGRNLYLIGATLIALGLVLLRGRPRGHAHARRSSRSTARDGDRDRLRPGAGAGPRRLALGRDDQRRPVPRLRPPSAARYSFLLSIPAVVLSGPVRAAQDRRARRPARRRRRRSSPPSSPSSSATRRSRSCCATSCATRCCSSSSTGWCSASS